jgi:hypothetical protein
MRGLFQVPCTIVAEAMEPHNGGLVPALGPHHVRPAVLQPAPAAPTCKHRSVFDQLTTPRAHRHRAAGHRGSIDDHRCSGRGARQRNEWVLKAGTAS